MEHNPSDRPKKNALEAAFLKIEDFHIWAIGKDDSRALGSSSVWWINVRVVEKWNALPLICNQEEVDSEY